MLRLQNSFARCLIAPVRSSFGTAIRGASFCISRSTVAALNQPGPQLRFTLQLAGAMPQTRVQPLITRTCRAGFKIAHHSSKTGPVVQPGDNVKVLYKGYLENGEKFIDGEDEALEFTVGSGEVVVGIERGILGMHVGEKRVLTIPPEEGFGMHDPSLVYDVPSSSLDEGFMRQVRLGSRIRLDEEPEEDGEERYGVVVDIRDDGVSIDANEELVGKTLIVHVTILQLEVKGTGNGLS